MYIHIYIYIYIYIYTHTHIYIVTARLCSFCYILYGAYRLCLSASISTCLGIVISRRNVFAA